MADNQAQDPFEPGGRFRDFDAFLTHCMEKASSRAAEFLDAQLDQQPQPIAAQAGHFFQDHQDDIRGGAAAAKRVWKAMIALITRFGWKLVSLLIGTLGLASAWAIITYGPIIASNPPAAVGVGVAGAWSFHYVRVMMSERPTVQEAASAAQQIREAFAIAHAQRNTARAQQLEERLTNQLVQIYLARAFRGILPHDRVALREAMLALAQVDPRASIQQIALEMLDSGTRPQPGQLAPA